MWLFGAIVLFCGRLNAQINTDSLFKPRQAVIVFTHQGVELSGIVSSVKDSTLVLKKSVKDSVLIRFSEISKAFIADENNFLNGKYIHPNIFAPLNENFATAFPLSKKTVLVRTTWFGLASLHLPLTKNLSAGYFTSFYGVPVSAYMRYSLKVSSHLYLAPEAGIMSASWVAPELWMWNGGLRATQGNSQKSVTIAAGYFEASGLKNYVTQARKKYEGVYINAGIQQRLSKRISLVADAWYISKPEVVSVGFFTRHHRKEFSVWSFGIMGLYGRVDGERFLIPLPVVQWCTKF